MKLPDVPFKEFLSPNSRPYELSADEDADLVGMRLYGGGPFHREHKPAVQIRKKDHFVVKVGDVIYNKRFVHLWLRSPIARDHVRRNAKGTSPSMKKISQGVVMAIPFPTLSLSDQQQILERIDLLSEKVKRMTESQLETASDLNAVMPSILDRAFTGDL